MGLPPEESPPGNPLAPPEPLQPTVSEPLSITVTATEVQVSPGVAVYAFDDQGGDTLRDAAEHSLHGRLGKLSDADSADPSWSAGISGGALSFDGVDDHVFVADSPQLQIAGSFTIEAWIYRVVDDAVDCIVQKGESQKRNYWLQIDEKARLELLWETAGGDNHGARTDRIIQTHRWHHVAAVYDQERGGESTLRRWSSRLAQK